MMRTALAQKAQAALLAKEQAQHLSASLSQITQLKASFAHNSSVGVCLQDGLAAIRYHLRQSGTAAIG